jgi:hypothetical protein
MVQSGIGIKPDQAKGKSSLIECFKTIYDPWQEVDSGQGSFLIPLQPIKYGEQIHLNN